MRVALGLEYDGRGFCGWQSQPNLCGVQDKIESAIYKISGQVSKVVVAGRTDTSVHALGQVAHFDTNVLRPVSNWVRGLNTFLPNQIRVTWASDVELGFHARYSAIRRRYQYWLFNGPVAPAIFFGKVGWYHRPLNLDLMQIAIQNLQGEHDFSAFRASECQAKSAVRHLYDASLVQVGNHFIFNFEANAFLYHQVRNMVGALVYVGKGACPPSYIKELLLAKDRRNAPPTFSPDGLYLTHVKYAESWNLPNRPVELAIKY